ncbi:DUF4419 domain-containing protein [Catellatospora sichuanensis]|uniref:DUF4419 domain-containing protein n=1 Tax=Catellatospora sichuanensis TaxID=1969805 RepID=UPI0011826A2A|nr:DUF4419 domain-containing protein [Catellatospora sichuanensis]
MVTFPVDDVTPAAEPLPTVPLGELTPEALAVGGDPALPVLAADNGILTPDGVHPLLGAIGRAFMDHRPLMLSPDAVWITIAQGVAQHVRLHAEELRPRLVGHTGKRRLTVFHDGAPPTDAQSWRDIVDQLSKQLGTEVTGADLFECDFSTSTDVERVVGRIIMLDAYSPYFAYWLICVCGIPSITLTGTTEDWRRIRDRVETIAELGLETWCRSLRPILDQFVRAASGDVDTAFWQRVYNPVDSYGGDVITGWATRFYPYLAGSGQVDYPNPMLDLPIDEPGGHPVREPGAMFYDGPGIRSSSVPATLATTVVNINDQTTGENRAVALRAGLVGIAQDDDGALRPVAGWHLAPATIQIDDVLDRVVRDHETTPPVPLSFDDASEELVALYSRVGSASLCGGALRFLPLAEHVQVWDQAAGQMVKVGELADGRALLAVIQDFTMHWAVCRIEPAGEPHPRDPGRVLDAAADVPVYGSSLAMLLEAAMDSGGDISHLEVGRLSGFSRGGD